MSSTGPSPSIKVKTETPDEDEAEIVLLATKMVEAHRAKAQSVQAAAQSRTMSSVPTGQTGQANIMNYLTRKSGAPASDKKPGEKTEGDRTSDDSSLRGHFGWAEIGKVHIPYILRQNEMYCAVHMVETKLLNKYLTYLHQDIYSCTCIRSYYITETEGRLLNEINFKHCDSQFGRDYFSTKDLVVRLSDANEFYQFLDVCYKKLLDNSNNPKDKCGFIRINGESVVPYTVRGGQKFVPLFYFEGETDNLKLKADSLEGWDLSYLKFCCKVQGIRNELFASETCAVISLSDIKSYFPPGTNFEDYWPSKVMDSQLLVATKGGTPQHVGHWTRQPVGPPPRVSTTQMPAQKAAARRVPATSQVNNQRMAHPIQNSVAHSATGMTAAAVQALSNGWAAAGLVGGQQATFPAGISHQHVLRMAQQQQQAHAQQAQAQAQAQVHQQQAHHQQAQAGRAAAYQKAANQAARQYQQYNPNSAAMALSSQQPPPLVRTTQQSNNIGSGALPQSYLLGMSGQSFISPSITNLPTPPPTSTPGYTTPPSAYYISPSTRSKPQYIPNTVGAQQRHDSHANSHETVIKNYSINSISSKHPPPLIPVNSSVIQRQNSAFATSALEVIDLSSPPRSPSIQRASVGNGRPPIMAAAPRGLTSIADIPTSGTHVPYKIQKALVEGQLVPSINMKPYIYTELLMTIVDLQQHFFPSVSTVRCRQALDALNVELYKGNRTQMRILLENGKCTANEVPPLVQVRDVMQYMPQLKYIISSAEGAPHSKRSKHS